MYAQEPILKKTYGFKRILAKLCIAVSKSDFIPSSIRIHILRIGGIKIGNNCFIGAGVNFDGLCPQLIEIGNDCVITSGTFILTHFYDTKKRRFMYGKVSIGNNVFIGLNTLIVNSVEIGNNIIIGAGSVINKDIPDNQIWAGNPARFIRDLELPN